MLGMSSTLSGLRVIGYSPVYDWGVFAVYTSV